MSAIIEIPLQVIGGDMNGIRVNALDVAIPRQKCLQTVCGLLGSDFVIVAPASDGPLGLQNPFNQRRENIIDKPLKRIDGGAGEIVRRSVPLVKKELAVERGAAQQGDNFLAPLFVTWMIDRKSTRLNSS